MSTRPFQGASNSSNAFVTLCQGSSGRSSSVPFPSNWRNACAPIRGTTCSTCSSAPKSCASSAACRNAASANGVKSVGCRIRLMFNMMSPRSSLVSSGPGMSSACRLGQRTPTAFIYARERDWAVRETWQDLTVKYGQARSSSWIDALPSNGPHRRFYFRGQPLEAAEYEIRLKRQALQSRPKMQSHALRVARDQTRVLLHEGVELGGRALQLASRSSERVEKSLDGGIGCGPPLNAELGCRPMLDGDVGCGPALDQAGDANGRFCRRIHGCTSLRPGDSSHGAFQWVNIYTIGPALPSRRKYAPDDHGGISTTLYAGIVTAAEGGAFAVPL